MRIINILLYIVCMMQCIFCVKDNNYLTKSDYKNVCSFNKNSNDSFSTLSAKLINIAIGCTQACDDNLLININSLSDELIHNDTIYAAFENFMINKYNYTYNHSIAHTFSNKSTFCKLSIYSKINFSFLMNVYKKKKFKDDKNKIAELLFTIRFGDVGTENEKFAIENKRNNINVLLCRDYIHGAYRIIFGTDTNNSLYINRDMQKIGYFIETNWYNKNQLCNETIEEITDYMLMSVNKNNDASESTSVNDSKPTKEDRRT